MGQYILTGPCTRIQAHEDERFSAEDILKKLGVTVHLDLFDRTDESGITTWCLKPRYLEDGFSDFVEKQFEIYSATIDITQTLTALKEAPTMQQRLALFDSGGQDLNLIDFTRAFSLGWGHYLACDFQMVGLFIDGKIRMQCYNDLFSYLEWHMQLQRTQYPIAGAMMMTIYG